ncbi:MAG: hypothetical protein RMK99_05945 [Anaerolineales bacterium]|nr:hypothetical protein [Anaerolineales bacterium]
MSTYTEIAPTQVLVDRPFTHPEHTLADIAYLRQIAHYLRITLNAAGPQAAVWRQRIIRTTVSEGRVLRMVICNGGELLRPAPMPVVGFFGQRRADAEYGPIGRVDEELLEEFLQHPHIIAYCSLELPSGDWGNLVVMSSPEAPLHWSASARHRYAAEELAPRYYASVRIHNAELPTGLMNGGELLLARTKYYDYRAPGHWRGRRELTPPQRFAFS